MTVSGEKLNLLIMRDSGETKRFRVRRSGFFFLISIVCSLPIITGLSIWGAYYLWQENYALKQRVITAEALNQENAATVKRLATLEELMKYEADLDSMLAKNTVKPSPPPRTLTQTNQSQADTQSTTTNAQATSAATANANGTNPQTTEQENPPNTTTTVSTTSQADITTNPEVATNSEEQDASAAAALQEGPGHEEFPVVDEGIIMIENVQSRLVEPRRIRTSLDLRNPGSTSLSGTVFCILSLASGEMIPLSLSPASVGNYRILRWKKAVLFADIASEYDLFNAQMIIEVKDTTGKLLYRNSFAIEQ